MSPESFQVREAARLLSLDARVKAADGDIRAALQDVNTLFAVPQHIGAESMLLSVLASMAIEQTAAKTLQHVLMAKSVSSDDLAVLNIEDAISYQKFLQRALRMEETLRLATFCDMGSNENISGVAGPLMVAYRVLLLSDALSGHSQLSRQLREMAAKPYYETKSQWKSFSEQVRHAQIGSILRLFMPALAFCAESAPRSDGLRQTARLGLVAEQYRLRHGKLPARLDDLTPDFIPAVPLDPFDGKPMRMKRTEHGLIIYSIGPDIVDDAGVPFDPQKRTGDVTFELSDRKP